MTSNQPDLSPDEQRAALAKAFRRLLPIIFLASMVCYIDRANIGYAQLGMGAELGITAATYGTIAAVFFIAYFICEVPSNILLERFGARVWITRIMVTWGLVTVLTGFVNNVNMLYACRILLGIAEAGFLPGMVLYLTVWFRARDRAVALGALFVAQPLAYIIAGAGSGLILDHIDWFGLSSWRWVFIISGIPAVLLSVVVFKVLPDSPAKAPWLNDRTRAWMVKTVEAERGPAVDKSLRAELAALRDSRIIHLAAVFLTYGVGFYGFTLFLPLIVKQINPSYSATNIGFVSVVPYIFAVAAVLGSARLARNTSHLSVLTVSSLIVLGAGLTGVVAFSGRPGFALVALCLAAIGTFAFLPAIWALSTLRIAPAYAAVGIAAVNSIGNLGGFFGPYLVGQGSIGSNVTAGLFAPIVSVAVAIVLLVLFVLRGAPQSEGEALPVETSVQPTLLGKRG
jgi:ACS family tartrate transporter-like MFS transporter